MNDFGVKFRFQEELALKSGLSAIASTVLKYSLEQTHGLYGVFFYLPPRAKFFELLASAGGTSEQLQKWNECPPDSKHPFVLSIHSGKAFFGVDETSGNTIAALPMGEENFCFLGFMVEIPPGKVLTQESREFLFQAAASAKSAIEQLSGEGV
jgi:hypothetical protein